MSFIDCFRHKFAGHMAGLPVYLPEERVEGDFTATEHSVVLGGGGGEHAGAVINAARAVGLAVDAYLEFMECRECQGRGEQGERFAFTPTICTFCRGTGLAAYDAPEDRPAHYIENYTPATEGFVKELVKAGLPSAKLYEALQDFVQELFGDEESTTGNYEDWRGDDWVRVVEFATKNSMGKAYDRATDSSIEHWLGRAVGEFVLVSCLERALTDPALDLSPETLVVVKAMRVVASYQAAFAAIAQYSSGYAISGRGESISDRNMHY